MRNLTILLFTFITFQSLGQRTLDNFGIKVGATFNASSTEYYNTTGIGIFVEPDYMINEKFRFGLRIEPTALAYGIGVIYGGCGGSCKEGANFLLGNYLKGEYMIGKPKYGPKGQRHQGYVGTNILILTHKRYIITSIVDNLKNTIETVTNFGFGVRLGAILGKFDLSTSFNNAGKDFSNYFGFNIGYQILQPRIFQRKTVKN